MKKWTINLVATLIPVYFLFAISCGNEPPPVPEEDIETNENSIIPSGNDFVGCVEISSHTVEVFLRTYVSNHTGFEFSISSNSSPNIYSENIGSVYSAERKNINFPHKGYNYLCIEPLVFPSGFTEYTLIISIGGIDRLVTLHPGVTSCIDVIVAHENISCPGNGTESDDFGKVEFWTDDMQGCNYVTVKVDGDGPYTISSSLSATPNCSNSSNSGLVNEIIPGSHSYTVTNCSGLNKTGTFNVNTNGCAIININNSSGGGSGTGNAIFWVDSPPDSGPFTVTIDGIGSSVVDGYFTSTPDCSDGSQGGLFENIPVGNYTFTVADYPPFSGPANLTITEDGCTQIDFLL